MLYYSLDIVIVKSGNYFTAFFPLSFFPTVSGWGRSNLTGIFFPQNKCCTDSCLSFLGGQNQNLETTLIWQRKICRHEAAFCFFFYLSCFLVFSFFYCVSPGKRKSTQAVNYAFYPSSPTYSYDRASPSPKKKRK